jgi:aryl-alcohol dehydrogenase-like predicted oxidoreductase
VLEVLPACEEYGLGVICYSPLAGAVQKAREGRRATTSNQQRFEENRNKLEEYEAFCRELGESPADLALAWLLSRPTVTAPIIGPRTIEQLDGALRTLDIDITDEISARIDEIFPGPGGPTPEAYAW